MYKYIPPRLYCLCRPSNSRTLTFDEVSQRCCVANEMVEMLLMKCFSLKVIKGVIDQVDSTVQITWVQPRVLDNDQIISMKERLLEWADSVDQTSAFINDNSGGL